MFYGVLVGYSKESDLKQNKAIQNIYRQDHNH